MLIKLLTKTYPCGTRRYWPSHIKTITTACSSIVLISCLSLDAYADDKESGTAVLVLYPDTQEPYNALYNQVISGMAGQGAQVYSHKISNDVIAASLRNLATKTGATRIVALGSRAADVAHNANFGIPVYAAMSNLIPGESKWPGLSIHIRPKVVFSKLKAMAPKIHTVYFIYTPKDVKSLIEAYQTDARAEGYRLVSIPVESATDALRSINEVVGKLSPKTDAVWLGQNITSMNQALTLPLIQEAIWEHEILFLTSNPSDVRDGVFMGLFPDYASLGRTLARTILSSTTTTQTSPPVNLLTDVRMAVNIRTAAHLGIPLTPADTGSGDLLFGRQ